MFLDSYMCSLSAYFPETEIGDKLLHRCHSIDTINYREIFFFYFYEDVSLGLENETARMRKAACYILKSAG